MMVRLHDQGAKVTIEGRDTVETRSDAAANGGDLLQSVSLDAWHGDF